MNTNKVRNRLSKTCFLILPLMLTACNTNTSIAAPMPENISNKKVSNKNNDVDQALVKLIIDAKATRKIPKQENINLAGKVYPALAPLGPVPEPKDNLMTPEKVELGKMLGFSCRHFNGVSRNCSLEKLTNYS